MNGDLIFVLLTVGVFAVMFGYVRICERLR
jgi:hypothetical protein